MTYCYSAQSVVRPSVRRKLSHFRLLLWNRWTEFNETWQKARSQRPLPSLCFSGRSEKQDGHPCLWLAQTFSTSPLKRLNGIQRTLTGSKISTPSTNDLNALYQVCVFRPIGKTRWPPWPLIGWDIFDFFSETAERNSTKLDRKQDLNVLYQVCVFFFGLIGKTRWPPLPLIGWDIFFSVTTERNSMKPDRKQDLNILYQVCVLSGWSEKQGGDPSSDWLDILNFSETAECKSKKLDRKQDLNFLYQVCVLSGRTEKQDGRSGLWLAESFLTPSLNLLNRIQWKLTGSKISTSSTKFVFFRTDRKNKMAALASDWLRHFRLLLWNRWREFNET